MSDLLGRRGPFVTAQNYFSISDTKRETASLSQDEIGYLYCQNTRMKGGKRQRLAFLTVGCLKCVPKCIMGYYFYCSLLAHREATHRKRRDFLANQLIIGGTVSDPPPQLSPTSPHSPSCVRTHATLASHARPNHSQLSDRMPTTLATLSS